MHMLPRVHTTQRLHSASLFDESNYFRIPKIVNGLSYSRCNLGRFLGRLSPLYAIWHPYKYAVTTCHAVFLPLPLYAVHGKLPDGHEIPTSRKLIFEERLFASLLVITHEVQDMLTLQVTANPRRAALLQPMCNYPN